MESECALSHVKITLFVYASVSLSKAEYKDPRPVPSTAICK
jgi:hypothetical protein